MRGRILSRDGHRCVYCGIIHPIDQLTIDHVQPRMRGGDNSEGNLVCACRLCNMEKSDLPAWHYLVSRPEQRANFLEYASHVWPRHRRAVLEAVRKARSPQA